MRKLLLALLTICMAVSSCTKEEESPAISATPAESDVAKEGGIVNITVTSNAPWTATCTDESFVITPSAGTGDAAVVITVPRNTMTVAHREKVTFKCTKGDNFASTQIGITQAAGDEPTVEPSSNEIGAEGGELTIKFTSPCSWEAKCVSEGKYVTYEGKYVQVSPKSGEAGTTELKVTVPPTAIAAKRLHKVNFKDASTGDHLRTFIVYQEAAATSFTVTKTSEELSAFGSTVKGKIKANFDWSQGKINTPEGTDIKTELVPAEGTPEEIEFTATIPETCTSGELTGFSVSITPSADFTGAGTPLAENLDITIPAPSVTLGGDTYKVVYLKDGNYWMAENLRYIPEGYTPSSDLNNVKAGVYNPVKLNASHTAVEFTTDEATVRSNGYLYQSEVALGLKVGDITTEDQAKALEGAQGICPAGWHIPTATEIINLVGKAVSPYDTKKDAPYYDADKGNATFDKLNADGFNANAWGAVTIQDNTKTSGTLMGFLKANPDIIGSGYICGSTYVSKTEKSGVITNFQFLGFMPMATLGTFNGSKLSYRIGASVRCVRNK